MPSGPFEAIGCRPGPEHVAAERGEREDVPIEVVIEGEVPWEPCAGEPWFVPGAVFSLVAHQPFDPPLRGRLVAFARSQDRHERPRGLGRRGGPAATPAGFDIGAQVFSPAAVRVLVFEEPTHPVGHPWVLWRHSC